MAHLPFEALARNAGGRLLMVDIVARAPAGFRLQC